MNKRLLLVVLLVPVLFITPARTSAVKAANGIARRITNTVAGNPIAAGHYLFWTDKRNDRDPRHGPTDLYGYDLTNGQEFLLAGGSGEKAGYASDGQTVVWVEHPRAHDVRLQGYDLNTRKRFTVRVPSTASDFGDIALSDGVLYYTDADAAHRGIFALTLPNGPERRVTSTVGQHLVVADGSLLWNEGSYNGVGTLPDVRLHLLKLDGSQPDTILAHGSGELSGYAVSDDHVVWSFAPPAADTRVHLYTISSAFDQVVSSGAALAPTIGTGDLVWSNLPDNLVDRPTHWSVQRFNLAKRATTTIVAGSTTPLAPVGIVNGGGVPLVVDDAGGLRSIALTGLQQTDVQLPPSVPPAQTVTMQALGGGQIARCWTTTNWLCDSTGARWKVNGTQFLLPQFGINTVGFYDGNYWSAVNDGSIEWWLGQGQNYLLDKNLRIFVDLPTGTSTPTSFATLYDFAQRADNHGMRLGLVLHNSADWNLSNERINWIWGLIDYFTARGTLYRIAYMSADNEINNHCGGTDCFTDQNYVNAAVGWTGGFNWAVKTRNKNILTTVGMSTETAGSSLDTQVGNFFKPDANGNRLATLVDFISPHNYGGGAYAIITAAQAPGRGYSGPIVLEEYGYPTDPKPRNALYTEGPPACKTDPGWPTTSSNYNLCKNTAPWFVEINTRAMRDLTAYAGGSAWMIADMNAANCNQVFDLYTGLFTAGGGYGCGGTYTPPGGNPKATAFRIRTHHYYY